MADYTVARCSAVAIAVGTFVMGLALDIVIMFIGRSPKVPTTKFDRTRLGVILDGTRVISLLP